MNEAQALRLITRTELDALARSGRRGARVIATLMLEAPGYTRRAAERLLHSLILKAQLPLPHFNFRLAGHDRDAVWLEHRLIVEVDGWAGHGHRMAFERDRRRDQQLAAAGFRTLRVTWRQLTHTPEAFVASLAATLASFPGTSLTPWPSALDRPGSPARR